MKMKIVVVVCLAAITLALCPMLCQAQPTITSVSPITTQQYQTITIKGSGFGKQAPYTGDSDYISLEDQTAQPAWQAGYSGFNDTVTLIVNSWTNDKITLGGFSGQWG
ncbi:MAG: IPT/TIG domain-containing protein, partial [Terriglobales bacterium]